MNTKSIRFRILFWCSLFLFLATALIFSSFYIVTRQILFQQVDKILITHADELAQVVISNGSIRGFTSEHLTSEFKDTPGMVVTVLDRNGGVIVSSLSVDTPFVSYKYLFDKANASLNPVYINQDLNNTPMRFVAEPVRNTNGLMAVVLVAHPIDAIQKSLSTLFVTLGVVFVLLIVPTILVVQLLATKILKPILEITANMERVSSEHFDERIVNPRSHDEIEKLVVTFNGLLDRLQEAFQRERQFIGDVAHELKTPVATVRSGIELALSKDRTNTEYKKELKETLVDINRLSGSLKNILDLAWMGTENVRSLNKKFSLSEVMGELQEVAIKLAAEKHIRVRGKISKSIALKGDKDKISRAILNVIDNAIKYTPRGGLISINLSKKSGISVVEVKDNGIGIPRREIPHIFERFYRGSMTQKTLGSGLGLAIAQNIINAGGGEIRVVSKVGKGTTIKIFMNS